MSFAKTRSYRATRALDVIRDPQDWTYKVPGLLTWWIMGMAVASLWLAPRTLLLSARVLAFYMLARFLMVAALYGVGLYRIRTWDREMRLWESRVSAGIDAGLLAAVHHVVIIPNYSEPIEVLARTLDGLAVQEAASERLTVVLAMEEAEANAREKAQALKVRYAGRFAQFLVTFHPARLPGEVAGKGANQAWAARQARRELVDRQKMRLEHLTLTSCDADSIFHPQYFATLTRLFAADPHRYQRFWQAPLLFDNNIWRVSAPIRLLTFFANAVQLAELAGPLAQAMPLSTYSLSFKLAEQAGYWDPAVIAEDWHMFLRCFFATRGEASVVPIFLPISGDGIIGANVWQSLLNFYRQQLRHAWGCQDVGYMLQQWRRWPGTPFHRKLLRLVKVIHDHLIWSAGAVVVATGALLSVILDAAPVITLPPDFAYPLIAHSMNLLGFIGTGTIWLAERHRVWHAQGDRRLSTLIQEIIAWITLPLLTFFLLGVPVVHAQTKMLLGSSLAYFRTPKDIGRS